MKKQRGAALLVILMIIGVVGAYFALSALNSGQARRDMETANTLAQAKDALIGHAATYRDTHANQIFGYLPCPDTNNDGNAEAICGAQNLSQTGRLPWSTLRLPPLRDSSGTCLWYAVSGTAKDNPPTAIFNWDTVGQFIVQDATGTILAGANAHDHPLAVILAPHAVLGAQTRPSGGASECGGSNILAGYLENTGTPNTIVLSTPDSVQNATNNDRGTWITNRDIFDRIKRRSDFSGTKGDINNMLDNLELCLNNLAIPPNASATNKGVGDYPTPGPDLNVNDVLSLCNPAAPRDRNVLNNWQDNLLYSKPGTLTSGKSCTAVLIFAGERTAAQLRDTPANKNIPANYLEGINATSFKIGLPPAGSFDMPSGSGSYSTLFPSRDVIRCITGMPPAVKSFASDFGSFTAVGTGVTPNATDKTLTIADAPGASGGCFWFANAIPLAGKSLRTYYDFKFTQPDTYALSGGTDRGNGFSLQMVRSDFAAPPNTCGTEARMGVLNDPWGALSFIFETDVRRTVGDTDSVENHTAIMFNGNLNHALSGTMSSACDGSASGCQHSPANKFEENPLLLHNQRIEIATGCNATCTVCNPASHAAPNNYARITTWVDCTECNDVVTDLDRVAKPPTIQRCTALFPELNSFYFGFTGGFQSGAATQGVTLQNFILRSE